MNVAYFTESPEMEPTVSSVRSFLAQSGEEVPKITTTP